MPTSDEDLQKKADEVAKLRDKVADAEADRVTRETYLSREITMKQLQAEEASLQARLTLAQDAKKAGNVKEGAGAPLQAATDAMEAAVQSQKAAEKAVKKDGE